MKNNEQKPGRVCLGLFWEFFKIGLFTIGGGVAMLPLIHKLVVEDKKWLDEDETVDCLAVSQALPGIISINCATYIGKRLCGIRGSLAATLGVVMPSFLIIIIVVSLLGTVSDSTVVQGVFMGVKAAVCGLIIVSAVRLGKNILKSPFAWIMAIISFLMIAVFDITALWAIALGAAAGVLYQAVWSGRRSGS